MRQRLWKAAQSLRLAIILAAAIAVRSQREERRASTALLGVEVRKGNMNHILVLCTASSEVEAKSIAHALVERKLAACVNIVGPMQSVYRWKGAVDEAQEYLLLIKTGAEHFESVRDAIVSLHSYEVPEVIQLSFEDGLPAYLSWISESLE